MTRSGCSTEDALTGPLVDLVLRTVFGAEEGGHRDAVLLHRGLHRLDGREGLRRVARLAAHVLHDTCDTHTGRPIDRPT